MKIIDIQSDKDTKVSKVSIKHRGKVYTAFSRCAEEDTYLQFRGCYYAEKKARIKALKDEYKDKKADCEACRKFVRALSQYKNFDPKSSLARAMNKQLGLKFKEVNELADNINASILSLKAVIRKHSLIEKRIKMDEEGQNQLNNKKEK